MPGPSIFPKGHLCEHVSLKQGFTTNLESPSNLSLSPCFLGGPTKKPEADGITHMVLKSGKYFDRLLEVGLGYDEGDEEFKGRREERGGRGGVGAEEGEGGEGGRGGGGERGGGGDDPFEFCCCFFLNEDAPSCCGWMKSCTT